MSEVGRAAAKARAEVFRSLQAAFGRLTTMQCPAKWEERMRDRAEAWEKVAAEYGDDE